MDESATTPGPMASKGPRGTTLADILVMVAGFAVFLIFPWFGFQPAEVPWLQARRDPNWFYTITGVLTEGVEKLCLVLAIVAGARKVRFGGPAYPAEFLLLFVAIHLLLTARAGSLWMAAAVQSPAGIGASLAIFCLAALVILGRRGRLSGSIGTAALAVAYLSLVVLDQGVGERAHLMAAYWGWPLAWELVPFALIHIPGALLFVGPYAGVVRASKESRSRWTWIEWAAAILATGWYLGLQVHFLASALLSDPLWFFLACLGVSWAVFLAAFLAAPHLGRRLGPILNRRGAADGPEPGIEEVPHDPNGPMMAGRAVPGVDPA